VIGVRANEKAYEFALSFETGEEEFQICDDTFRVKLDLHELKREGDRLTKVGELGSGEISLANIEGRFEYHVDLPDAAPVEQDDVLVLFEPDKEEPLLSTALTRALIINRPLFVLRPPLGEEFLSDVSIYDFDPKLPKQAIPITGKMDLEEDGSNLAIVLRSILEDQEQHRKFLNLLKDVLGFVDGLRVMPLADRSLLFALQETYTQDEFLPASFISDGTIHVVALIIALYFDDNPVVIIEEPERNIHPFLIARVVDMLEEASEKKQIIVTTHNPEVVKHAGVENILLVSRDKEGFSTITRPRDSEEVAVFLRNEIGIEDLFVQDLLRP